MSELITVAEYLLIRLKEAGIDHIFGVPGDYNLELLDYVENNPDVQWIGTCNELNGAYATDGYSRTKGMGALITTFGVGELSAINGIAGAYAEYCPVVKIAGMPSLKKQHSKALVHHTLGGGNFSVFAEMYKKVTVAQTLLQDVSAGDEIDRVLRECWKQKRPVYIGLPTDVVKLKIPQPTKPLDLSYATPIPEELDEATDAIVSLLSKSKNPIVLADICAMRHGMKPLLHRLLSLTGLPFATMNMAKGIINESHPQFIGNYCGAFGTPNVKKRVETSDCIISCGTLLTDLNTGGFTTELKVETQCQVHGHWTKVHHALYENLPGSCVLQGLIDKLRRYRYSGSPIEHPSKKLVPQADKLSQNYFWTRIQEMIPQNSTVICETGTSLFGGYTMQLKDDVHFISQTLWASIGYSVGSLLGAQIGSPRSPTFLFVGDGSFQLTEQELSTIMHHKLNPIIFLLNNDGYTIERVIHGEKMPYNDITPWNYTNIPKAFGKNCETFLVKTLDDLEEVIKKLEIPSKNLRFVEVFLPRMDSPEMLTNIVAAQKQTH